jgi:hypothetical protein
MAGRHQTSIRERKDSWPALRQQIRRLSWELEISESIGNSLSRKMAQFVKRHDSEVGRAAKKREGRQADDRKRMIAGKLDCSFVATAKRITRHFHTIFHCVISSPFTWKLVGLLDRPFQSVVSNDQQLTEAASRFESAMVHFADDQRSSFWFSRLR